MVSDEVARMTDLQELSLRANALRRLPVGLAQLELLPDELGLLMNLQMLNLGIN